MSNSQQRVAPTLAQRQLAQRLRTLRERSGKKQADAAVGLDCDESKIYRIESCRTAAKLSDVKALAELYGGSTAETADLIRLARGAKDKGWTEPYLDSLPVNLSVLGDLESTASGIDAYCTEVLHGLLQTPAYAGHIIGLNELPRERQRTLLNFRLDRQRAVFSREDLPTLQFIIHEAALRAEAGPAELMPDQLDHLRTLDHDGTARIRVWTAANGVHPWMSGAFTLLNFSTDDPTVVYLENLVELRFLETRTTITRFEHVFGEISRRAIPIKEYR